MVAASQTLDILERDRERERELADREMELDQLGVPIVLAEDTGSVPSTISAPGPDTLGLSGHLHWYACIHTQTSTYK